MRKVEFNAEDWADELPWYFGYDPEGFPYVWLWDDIGFFTHVPESLWVRRITAKLPPVYTEAQLDGLVRAFMKDYRHLYCCMN